MKKEVGGKGRRKQEKEEIKDQNTLNETRKKLLKDVKEAINLFKKLLYKLEYRRKGQMVAFSRLELR